MTSKGDHHMTTHTTATRTQWLAARVELLEAEKELTRRSDDVARRRQQLPWVPVKKDYRFETEAGAASLDHLFGGRSQLLVYHFMFGPEYTGGCPSCSGTIAYNYRPTDTTWLRERGEEGGAAEHAAMTGTDTATYLREQPGMSAFALEDGVIYHTYSAYARGLDGLWGMYQWLDRAPKGRNENGAWWRRRDDY
jgi:predicted dithiol-disulfide oxidoreductase (DUF899 family)